MVHVLELVMPPALIVLAWLICGLLLSAVVVAALVLSSRISQREGVEQPMDDTEAETLQRFPRSR